ncbi:hypothetical protein IWW50_000113 [Coemansia erecta]|nr:hypothetical protein IWW50_000113 [Coemansia erecta]
MVTFIMLRKEQTHQFEDIEHFNPGYVNCPSDPEIASRVVCDSGLNYMYCSLRCRRFNEVSSINKVQILTLAEMPDQQ